MCDMVRITSKARSCQSTKLLLRRRVCWLTTDFTLPSLLSSRREPFRRDTGHIQLGEHINPHLDLIALTAKRANAFMHAWNSKYVEQSYDKQTLGFLTKFNSKTRLHPARIAMPFRRLVTHEGHDPHDPATLTKARAESRTIPPRFPYETLNWLGFTMMLSELGKRKELDDLLEYADEYLNPTWENGGLYYPRNGKILDKEWNLTHIEPHSGNSGIGYSRLNVTDGQKIMWERPWTRDVLEGRPWIDGDGFEDDIDFLRGVWDVEKRAMVLTVRRWRGEEKVAMFVLKNVEDETRWAIYVNGKLKDVREASQVGQIEFKELIGQEEVSFVVQQLV